MASRRVKVIRAIFFRRPRLLARLLRPGAAGRAEGTLQRVC